MIVEQIYVDIIRTVLGLQTNQVYIGTQNFKIANNNDLSVIVSVADSYPMCNNSSFDPHLLAESLILVNDRIENLSYNDEPNLISYNENDDLLEVKIFDISNQFDGKLACYVPNAVFDLYFLVDEPNESMTSVIRYDIQIDLVSKDNTARDIRAKVLMALNSFYAQSQQQIYQFRMFPISRTFINTTELEGGSQLNRFTIIIPSLFLENNRVSSTYYDTFSNNEIFNK